jgi:hypothetical protein
MKKAGRTAVAVVLMLIGATVLAARESPLTNADVVGMVNAGLGTNTIIAKIKASATSFQLDTASLAILTQQGVPDLVIQAMIERQSPGQAEVGVQAWPRSSTKKIWSDVVRVVGRCQSRGEVMLFDNGVQFAPVQGSTACLDTDMRFTVVWGQIDAICFKYLVLDNATVGVLAIQTKGANSYQVRGSQMSIQAMEGEFKFRQSRLNYRCD